MPAASSAVAGARRAAAFLLPALLMLLAAAQHAGPIAAQAQLPPLTGMLVTLSATAEADGSGAGLVVRITLDNQTGADVPTSASKRPCRRARGSRRSRARRSMRRRSTSMTAR
jgi:hypothetical protein